MPSSEQNQQTNELNPRQRELVALGAALGSNCVPCIEYHIPESRKVGLSDAQISAAIELADKVRQVPAKKVLDAAMRTLDTTVAGSTPGDADDACGETGSSVVDEQPCCP